MLLVLKKGDAERRMFLDAQRKKDMADFKEACTFAPVRASPLKHEEDGMEHRVAARGDSPILLRPMSVRPKLQRSRLF